MIHRPSSLTARMNEFRIWPRDAGFAATRESAPLAALAESAGHNRDRESAVQRLCSEKRLPPARAPAIPRVRLDRNSAFGIRGAPSSAGLRVPGARSRLPLRVRTSRARGLVATIAAVRAWLDRKELVRARAGEASACRRLRADLRQELRHWPRLHQRRPYRLRRTKS